MTKSAVEQANHMPFKVKFLNKNNSRVVKILRRKDFLAARSQLKFNAAGFQLQAWERTPLDGTPLDKLIRVGFTCSRRVGNAVRRNIAKRRLRHLARECLPIFGRNGWDYVIIGHYKNTEEITFNELKMSFIRAIKKIHGVESAK